MIHTKTNYTARSLIRKAKSGEIIFDTPLQRGYVWDYTRKSLLIHSILIDYAIPQFYMRKVGNKCEVFDGKQRYSAIKEFLANEYALRNVPDIMFHGKPYSLNRKKFAELPKELQETIEGYSLDFQVFDDVTDEQIADMFFRLNNGKSLKQVELIKAQSKSLDEITELRKNPLFAEFYSDKQIQASDDIEMIMKTWMILFGESRNLLSSRIELEMKRVKVSEEQLDRMNEVFDYLRKMLSIIRSHGNRITITKIHKKAATVAVIYAVDYAIKNCIEPERLAVWAEEFFTTDNASSDPAYNENVTRGGLAKEKSVVERFQIIERSLKAFIQQ